jgi:hypothetical protein
LEPKVHVVILNEIIWSHRVDQNGIRVCFSSEILFVCTVGCGHRELASQECIAHSGNTAVTVTNGYFMCFPRRGSV